MPPDAALAVKGYILLMKRHMLYKVHEMEVMQSAYLPKNCTHTKIIDSSSITAFKNLKINILGPVKKLFSVKIGSIFDSSEALSWSRNT